MKPESNKFIKQNHDQIQREKKDTFFSPIPSMVYCPQQKEMVNKNRCRGCIFYHPERINWCDFDNWKPGLRKGRE